MIVIFLSFFWKCYGNIISVILSCVTFVNILTHYEAKKLTYFLNKIWPRKLREVLHSKAFAVYRRYEILKANFIRFISHSQLLVNDRHRAEHYELMGEIYFHQILKTSFWQIFSKIIDSSGKTALIDV